MIITELRKTCDACPAQWEAKTPDGQFVYIRYRYGVLTMGVGPSIDHAIHHRHDHQLTIDESGWSGTMSTAEMLGTLGLQVQSSP